MITHNDQLDLFNKISKKLNKDIKCYAFGGTAMMFYGFKEETKDIDILFEDENDRTEFIEVIKSMGFKEHSPLKIYSLKKIRDKNVPLMLILDNFRFDLFVKQIFRTKLSPKMKEDRMAVHDFKGKSTLTIHVLKTEHIVMLKEVTEREKDLDDIITIVDKNTNFNWQYFMDEIAWQYENGNDWIILDTKEMLLKLKKYRFIPEKYFKQVYAIEKKK